MTLFVSAAQLPHFIFQALQIRLQHSRSPPPDSRPHDLSPRPRTPLQKRMIEKAKLVQRQIKNIAWRTCTGVQFIFLFHEKENSKVLVCLPIPCNFPTLSVVLSQINLNKQVINKYSLLFKKDSVFSFKKK